MRRRVSGEFEHKDAYILFIYCSEMRMEKYDPLQMAIEYKGPRQFTRRQVAASSDLFSERCALFYTPTANLPKNWVGQGDLDVTLPVATPSYYEFWESRLYQTPRFWVDLLQRATGKLRWMPFYPAHITLIRYDSIELPCHFMCGAKALLDSFKVSTTGRSDGRLLHYFGAIVDDSPSHIKCDYKQELVEHPSQAKTRVIITQGIHDEDGLRVIARREVK